MFNLPFPTDSLYKFAFMFGLVMIVFSIYFRDKELNRYDKHQLKYLVDSLKITINDLKSRDSLIDKSNEFNVNLLSSRIKKFDTLGVQNVLRLFKLSEEVNVKQLDRETKSYYLRLLDFKNMNGMYYLDNTLSGYYSFGSYNRKYSLRKIKTELSFYEKKLDNQKHNYWLLLAGGIILFIPGIILWYFKIQKPQDKILKLQLEEALKKAIEAEFKRPTILGRKHFEPQILPRQEVRNRI